LPAQKAFTASSFTLFQGSSNTEQLALILLAKGSPSTAQMKSINPLWKEQILENASLPAFLSKVLID